MPNSSESDRAYNPWLEMFIVLSVILATPIVIACLISWSLPTIGELTQYFVWLAVIPPFATLFWLSLGLVVLVCRLRQQVNRGNP